MIFFYPNQTIHPMPTFNERLEVYRQRPDAVAFPKKKLKSLHNALARIFDRNRPGFTHTYTGSEEAGQIYPVRVYPATFTKTIDSLINKLHYKCLGVTIVAAQRPAKSPTRARKRMPARKTPIWKSKI
jgi:hypothetical protein